MNNNIKKIFFPKVKRKNKIYNKKQEKGEIIQWYFWNWVMCKIMNKILKELGISEKVYGEMQELCPNINELSDDEIMNKVNILKQINCNDMQIKNIVSSNVQYLDRSENDIQKLISKMKETGFTTLNILFDGNPYILNLDDFEIENYIENRAKEGEKVEDIVDDWESNPYLFQEI